MNTKANPDYQESAVNLTNPPQVAELLGQLKVATNHRASVKLSLEDQHPELFAAIREDDAEIALLESKIKLAIDQFGSWQDTYAGSYGVKQRRVSVTYIPAEVRRIVPNYAQAVIEETVNKVKMGGLLKGKLITQEQADACSEKTETYGYIIKC